MKRRKQLFETPAKIIYEGPEPDTLVQYFRDSDAGKETGDGRGVLNNRISEHFYQCLDEVGIPNHFVRRLNMREQLVRNIEYLPVALMVRNLADGNLATRLGLSKGTRLHRPVVELYLSDLRLDDPIVTEEHIAAFGWIAPQDLDEMLAIASRTHDLVSGMLMASGLTLIDIRLEFGRFYESHPPRPGMNEDLREEMRVMLCSDLSPDTMRLYDRNKSETMEETGYEPWRASVVATGKQGKPLNATSHQEIATRLGILPTAGAVDLQGPSTIQ